MSSQQEKVEMKKELDLITAKYMLMLLYRSTDVLEQTR